MGNLQTESWRILHIDDDEDDHIIMQSMVREFQGRAVTLDWASSYENGLQKLNTNQYQAVLVDYDLGSHSGIDLIREAVGKGYTTPMILVTGRGSYDVDVEAMQVGATLYLAKDEANPSLLERSIRYAIERKVIESRLQTNISGLARELQEKQRVESILWKEREALHDIERKFTRVFEKSICAAALSKLSDGILVNVNEAWQQLFGYSRQEVIGKTM
jgi:ActR/RegA family two-component response regulator